MNGLIRWGHCACCQRSCDDGAALCRECEEDRGRQGEDPLPSLTHVDARTVVYALLWGVALWALAVIYIGARG